MKRFAALFLLLTTPVQAITIETPPPPPPPPDIVIPISPDAPDSDPWVVAPMRPDTGKACCTLPNGSILFVPTINIDRFQKKPLARCLALVVRPVCNERQQGWAK